jgi:hypothetical protein
LLATLLSGNVACLQPSCYWRFDVAGISAVAGDVAFVPAVASGSANDSVPAVAGLSTVADFPTISGVPAAVLQLLLLLLLASPQNPSSMLLLAFLLLHASLHLLMFVL